MESPTKKRKVQKEILTKIRGLDVFQTFLKKGTSEIALPSFVGVDRLKKETFLESTETVLTALWNARPSYLGPLEIKRRTGIDVTTVRNDSGQRLKKFLMDFTEQKQYNTTIVPSTTGHIDNILYDEKTDSFRWINVGESKGADYSGYRSLRAEIMQNGKQYLFRDAARRLVVAALDNSVGEINFSKLRTMTSRVKSCVVADEEDIIERFFCGYGVDLEEERELAKELVETYATAQRPTGGVWYRSGSFVWIEPPLKFRLQDSSAIKSTERNVITVTSKSDFFNELQQLDQQAFDSYDPGCSVGIHNKNIEPINELKIYVSFEEIYCVDRKTGLENKGGERWYEGDVIIYQKDERLKRLGDKCWLALKHSGVTTLPITSTEINDEATSNDTEVIQTEVPVDESLKCLDQVVCSRILTRAFYGAPEIVVMDAICSRGSMPRTELLRMLRLRQTPAMDNLVRGGLVQLEGGHYHLAKRNRFLNILQDLHEAIPKSSPHKLVNLLRLS